MHRIHSTRSIRAAALKSFVGREAPRSIPPEVCEACYSDLVQPVDAQANSAGTVRMTLRCPECDHVRVGECSWDEARAYGRHFAEGKAQLRGHYEQLADENLRAEVDCLVVALHTDLIGPDDFAPYRYSD
ncbi:MAG: hypothetical protein JHD02_07810 [Thermoleophilaceae bacterium]|nr:hypothetical protein [Thermoleophilaceae bacterium]